MPLSPEARAEINRRNAAKSTGPKTEAGKQASRRNALTHGLRAEVVALPNEDPAAVQARSDAWNDYYQPQSPAAQHLVNRCVSATLLADRVDAYHAAVVSRQMRAARPAYDVARREDVDRFLGLLHSDTMLAVRGLYRSAAGCRELIERWSRLEQSLHENGTWTNSERDESILLQGYSPRVLAASPEAWVTFLHVVLSRETPPPDVIDRLFEPGILPDSLRGIYRADSLPEREVARRHLRDLAADSLARLRALEEQLRLTREEPERDEAPAAALIPVKKREADAARLFLRYHSEARTTFHRAYSELVKTLARDAERADDDAPEPAPDVSPNEASAPAPAPEPEVEAEPEAESPNEARPGRKSRGRRARNEAGFAPGRKGSPAPTAADPVPDRAGNRNPVV